MKFRVSDNPLGHTLRDYIRTYARYIVPFWTSWFWFGFVAAVIQLFELDYFWSFVLSAPPFVASFIWLCIPFMTRKIPREKMYSIMLIAPVFAILSMLVCGGIATLIHSVVVGS